MNNSTALQHRMEEKSGDHFSLEQLMSVRAKSWNVLNAIAEKMHIGQTEEELKSIAKDLLAKAGAETQWHKINIRFAENTTKNFRDNSDAGGRLTPGEIAYIDLGPVFDGFEGDVGKTYVIGKNERLERLARDSEEIFHIASKEWKQNGLSGVALYSLMEREAMERGWTLIGRHMSGHRLADFPHQNYFRGKISDVEYALSPYAWVLEVCLIDLVTKRGAFYEDLLF